MEDIEKLSFEEALQSLEAIVEELDQGELSLEEAVAKFQEGTRLKGLCERKLTEAEATIEELLQEAGDVEDSGTSENLLDEQ